MHAPHIFTRHRVKHSIYLVDKILPILDESQCVFVAVLIVSESEHRPSSPQVQLTKSLAYCHLTLGTLVQLLT